GRISWWTNPEEPIDALLAGRAAMATVLNGSVFDAALHHRVVSTIWDRCLY
ncbi:MAG: hypothetical protein JOZ55_01530, partial [Alphaproteobacteria bacterium]|nr:hypothetical protein [Alphaproteobacteria bacterium]